MTEQEVGLDIGRDTAASSMVRPVRLEDEARRASKDGPSARKLAELDVFDAETTRSGDVNWKREAAAGLSAHASEGSSYGAHRRSAGHRPGSDVGEVQEAQFEAMGGRAARAGSQTCLRRGSSRKSLFERRRQRYTNRDARAGDPGCRRLG